MHALALAAMAFALAGTPMATAAATDLQHLVFVPSRDSPDVVVIDTRTDTVVRHVGMGTPPRQVAISASLDLLLTSNPSESAIRIVDLAGDGSVQLIPLEDAPEHMQLDPSGRLLAVSNFATGSVVLVDLSTRRQTTRLAGLPGPHHLAFARDGKLLYVGNLDLDQVSVVDVAAGRVVEQIPLRRAEDAAGGVRTLTLSVDGRQGFATFGEGNELAVFDLAGEHHVQQLALGELPRRAYATADGRRLVVPNDADDTISIVDPARLAEVARVPGGLVMTGVTTGWFETTAFVFARTQRKGIVIDLDQGGIVGEIKLPGRPEAGVTTPDGAKIYVALGDDNAVAVIDTRERRLTTVIEGVGEHPWGAHMVGTINYCH